MCGRVRLKWEVEISYDCGVSAFLVVLIDTLIFCIYSAYNYIVTFELTCVSSKKHTNLCYA